MLDLLDYCQRSLTRLLVKSERGREGKMIESEGSSSEEDDGENLPSKKKILMVLWVWLREGRGRERERAFYLFPLHRNSRNRSKHYNSVSV